MKKAKLIFIFTIICFAFMPKVFATNYMSVSKDNVRVGEEFTISVSTDFEISAWNIVVTPTDNASDCHIESTSPTIGDGTGPGSRESKTCVINSPGTATFTLTGTIRTVGTDEQPEGETITLNETVDVTIIANEEPRGLASMSVSNGTLSPTFDSNNLENTGYTITLDSSETSTFSINAVAKTTTDSIVAERATGGNSENYEPINLSNINFTTAGDNSTMRIRISVGEGERLVRYDIVVARPTPPEIDPPELSLLAIDGEEINLIPGQREYEVTREDKDEYFITATIKDTTNYRFSEFLTPPVATSSKDIELRIVPKDTSAGLESTSYFIIIKTNSIEPVTSSKQTTTKKPSGGGSSGGNTENPQTGSTSVTIVGIILVASLLASMYLYKKNINGYN